MRQAEEGRGVCSALCATHTQTNTCVSPRTCAHHMHVSSCGVWSECGTLVQVALTDLEDVVDGGGQRLAYAGYV